MIVFLANFIGWHQIKIFLEREKSNDSSEKIKWVCLWILIELHSIIKKVV